MLRLTAHLGLMEITIEIGHFNVYFAVFRYLNECQIMWQKKLSKVAK